MALNAGDYRPRDAEHTVLYRVIDEHLEAFLATAGRHADGASLPAFVEQEFRDFLTCGVLAHGFARLRCTDCAFERLVPFSCKGRGFCPSCGGRRMTEGAARLVDEILPRVPVRQWVLSLPSHLAGFDLHANVDAPAADRTRLEQLCRYLLRPAGAQDRLRLLDDGRAILTLKRAWADGTRQLLFESLELLEKLAALIPRPPINLVLYHGVLAPHSSWRARVVAYGAPPAEVPVAASTAGGADDEPTTDPAVRYWAWADLMRRAFDIDVLACPRCGGRLRLIATEEADAIRAILGALAASELAGRPPPRVPALNVG